MSRSLGNRTFTTILLDGIMSWLSGYGGIGRRAGFRFQWETVQVQVLLAALLLRHPLRGAFFLLRVRKLGGGALNSRLPETETLI